jgi:tetratricopeptide (TPR) repeat protein
MHVTQNITSTAGFAYGVIGGDLYVQGDGQPVYLLAEYCPPPRPETSWLLAQPSRLLDARHALVPFTGRETEQAEFARWRDGRSRLSVRWLYGSGGQGKTRFAEEVAQQGTAEGWKVITAVHGPGAALASAGSQDLRLDGARGLLFIVDYADRWPVSHLNWLFSNTLLQQNARTRVLLLARSARPWPVVRSALNDYQADTSDRLLRPIPSGHGRGDHERERLFNVARDCFAAYYGIADPSGISPPATLGHSGFALTLSLHMAALVGVDAHARRASPPQEIAGLSAYLLDREREHWALLYENHLQGLDYQTPPDVMARAVFTAALTGAAAHADGTAILHRLDLETHPSRLLADHAVCYPPSDNSSVLEPLYPDRLAEDFIALSLPGHLETSAPASSWADPAVLVLAVRQADGSPPEHIARTITFLASAAAPGRWPHVARYLAAILNADSELAVEAGSAALTALAEVDDLDPILLEGIAAQLPPGANTDLDVGAAALTARVVQTRLTETTDPAERERLYTLLALRQGYAGLDNEALAAQQQVVVICRHLAKADPAAYEHRLAGALSSLGGRLATVGQHAQALRMGQQGASLYRRLARKDPAAHEAGLAASLNVLYERLAAVGRYSEALRAAEEAADVTQHLADANPGRYEREQARALFALSSAQTNVGQHRETLANTEKAVAIYRRLAKADAPAHELNYAFALEQLGVRLHKAGRHLEAVEAAEESVRIFQRLAETNPRARERDLAGSLHNLVGPLSALGRQDQALAAAEQATAIFERLSGTFPAYEPDVARTLVNLGTVRAKLSMMPEAADALKRAVVIQRRLADAYPDRYNPKLARSLSNLSICLTGIGRTQDAVQVAEEAVGINRQLARKNPTEHDPDLAASLTNLGICLDRAGLAGTPDQGHLDYAVRVARQAVDVCRRLARANPAAYEGQLAGALINLTECMAGVGQTNEAARMADEAPGVYRRVADRDPAYRGSLAKSLWTAARMKTTAKNGLDTALTQATEAVDIYRALAQSGPGAHPTMLEEALNTQADLLFLLGHEEEAEEIRRELGKNTSRAPRSFPRLRKRIHARLHPDLE